MAKIKRPRKPARRASPAAPAVPDRQLRTKAVCEKLGVSRVTLWRAVKDGRLPQPNRHISWRVPLWSERAIDALIARSAR